MRRSLRCLMVWCVAVEFYSPTFICGQTQPGIARPSGVAGYVRAAAVDTTQINPNAAIPTLMMPPDGSASSAIFNNPTLGRTGNPNAHSNPHFSNNGGNIPGLATASTFGGGFAAQAGPSKGAVFKYTILGNDPAEGGTTNVPTNIDEVSWTLLNADKSIFKTVQFAPFETLTLNSPNFQNSTYTSSPTPTQFADAVQRAEFYQTLQPSQPWHTQLSPSVVNRVNITVPQFVNILLSNGSVIQAQSYFTGTAPDGSTFVLMLDLLFNFFFDNEVVGDINAGGFTEDGLNVTAFPNTFLFSLNLNNPNTPGVCCELGMHTYLFDNSTPQNRVLALWESWISPGLFGGGIQDVTALSHEVSESFNNPFLDNAAPNWQFPGQPSNSTVCQDNLETADPIEVLQGATFPLTLSGYTYHPQNDALLQWFGMGATSNAINGAFSYPDTTVLPHSALPCPL